MTACCSSQSPRKIDSVWSWVVCLVASFSMALALGFINCFAVIMPIYIELFKESKLKTALVGSIALGLVFFLMPLSTIVVKRTNFRIAGLMGLSMVCTSLVTTSFIKNLLQAFFSYSILCGVGASLLFTSNILALTQYFDKRRSAAIGIFTSGQNIGAMVLGPLMQLLIDLYGMAWMYRIIAAVCLVAILLIAVTFDTNVESVGQQQSSDNENQGGFTCTNIIKIFKTPAYVIAATALTLEAFTAFVSYVHLISYCIEVDIEAQKASRLFIAIGISATISCIISGRVLDIQAVNPFHVTQAGGLSMGLSMVLVYFASSYTHFIIYSVFLGLGLGTFLTTVVVLLMKTVEVQFSVVALSFGQTITSLGNFFGPPFVGFIADTQGSYRPAFLTAGGIMLFAFALPFLQYCFKPWRERTLTRSLSNITKEVVLSDEEKENRKQKRLDDEGGPNDARDESHVNAVCTDIDENQPSNKSHQDVVVDNQGVEESIIELHSHTNIAFELVEKDGTIERECETADEQETNEQSGNSVEVTEECETHL